MTRRRWKKRYPQSMQEAIRLCLDYAQHRHNRNAKRVADLNGISEWAVYKWMSEGNIPSRRIPPFEMACDCHYVTEYLGHAAQKVMVDVPRGRDVSQGDLLELQTQLNDVVNQLSRFYREDTGAAPALGALSEAMTALAGHRENVLKHDAPELALFDGGEA